MVVYVRKRCFSPVSEVTFLDTNGIWVHDASVVSTITSQEQWVQTCEAVAMWSLRVLPELRSINEC